MRLGLIRFELVGCLGLIGCLGPQVGDLPGPSGDIVPAGTPIPSIDEDAEDAALIAANDGVDGVVPRLTGFAGGQPIHVWDFGSAPEFAAPVFVLHRRDGTGALVRLPHNGIVGTIPGDPGYSPFWAVYALVVTARYSGELLTSSTAVEEAVRDGLVEAPIAIPTGVNGPEVAADIRLDVGAAAPVPPTSAFYYERHTVAYFDFGAMPLVAHVRIPINPRYVLHREGQEPLSEPIRHVDLDADGDALDTNDIYEHAANDADRSPLCRDVTVAVGSSTISIDTTGNDTMAELRDAQQLFAPGPTSAVKAFAATDVLRNCPMQRQAGGL